MNGNAIETFVASFHDILNLDAGEKVLWISNAMKIDLVPILKEVPRDTTDWLLWKGASFHLWLAMKDGLINGFLIVSNKRMRFFKAEMERSKSLVWKSIQLDLILEVDIRDIKNIKSMENYLELFFWNRGEVDVLLLANFKEIDPKHPGYTQVPTFIDIDKVTPNLGEIVLIGKK